MMKTLGIPESFSKKVSKRFSSKYLKKENALVLMTVFATVSQIANHCKYHVASQSFVTVELTNVTSQDYAININDMGKY